MIIMQVTMDLQWFSLRISRSRSKSFNIGYLPIPKCWIRMNLTHCNNCYRNKEFFTFTRSNFLIDMQWNSRTVEPTVEKESSAATLMAEGDKAAQQRKDQSSLNFAKYQSMKKCPDADDLHPLWISLVFTAGKKKSIKTPIQLMFDNRTLCINRRWAPIKLKCIKNINGYHYYFYQLKLLTL